MVEAPETAEGWYVFHEFRSVDWDAWRAAPDRERDRAVDEGVRFLTDCERVADAEDGASAVFSVLGHEADLLFIHFRPTLDDLSALERRFEDTALAGVTERSTSYVSVTEVSDYVSDEYFAEGEEAETGIQRYIEGKLEPEIPDGEYVSFYPMSRRRGEEHNWYELDYDERSDLLSAHGEIGKEYAGEIKQVIASSVGLDDHEWGVTLFGSDPTRIKDIVYEMRFDEASSKYGEFGQFYVGRRFPPSDLGAYLAGEKVPTADHAAAPGGESAVGAGSADGHPHGEGTHGGGEADPHSEGDHPHGDGAHGDSGDHPHGSGGAPGEDARGDDGARGEGGADGSARGGAPPEAATGDDPAEAESIRGELEDLDIYAGQPRGEDVYATVLYSEADVDDVFDEVDGLRRNFDHYDTHVKTAVYEARGRDRAAVVSIWDTASAAETAAGFLSDLPGIVERAGEESGFGTMGMFYTIQPEHREAFVERFDDVEDLLSDMDGHIETDLMVNAEDENDTFIASQWRAQEDAMAFFRSEEFGQAVEFGREVLADRPRHVFLA